MCSSTALMISWMTAKWGVHCWNQKQIYVQGFWWNTQLHNIWLEYWHLENRRQSLIKWFSYVLLTWHEAERTRFSYLATLSIICLSTQSGSSVPVWHTQNTPIKCWGVSFIDINIFKKWNILGTSFNNLYLCLFQNIFTVINFQ